MYHKKMFGRVLTRLEEKVKPNQIHKANDTAVQEPREQGATFYQYFCESTDACDECTRRDGRVFLVSEAQEGVNLPPMHRNCKCEVASYFGADALLLAERFYGINDAPGGLSFDDWRFYGLQGDSFDSNPSTLYRDEDFGKPIDGTQARRQNDAAFKDMHIVDRIARVLYEEHTTSNLCQSGLAWVMLNRLFSKDFPDDLQTMLIGKNQFEVFYEPVSAGRYDALRPDTESDGWQNALLLAKMLVSVSCNPNLAPKEKRNAFEAWVPNPFKLNAGDEVQERRGKLDPYNVKYWYGGFSWDESKAEQVDGFISLGYGNYLFNAFYEEYTEFR